MRSSLKPLRRRRRRQSAAKYGAAVAGRHICRGWNPRGADAAAALELGSSRRSRRLGIMARAEQTGAEAHSRARRSAAKVNAPGPTGS